MSIQARRILSLGLLTMAVSACNLGRPSGSVVPGTATLPPVTATPEAAATISPAPVTPTSLPEAMVTPATAEAVGPAIVPLVPGTPAAITSLRMVDASRGWAIGGLNAREDHVLTTADGGVTWRDVTPPEPARTGSQPHKLAIAAFADATGAWVTYYSGEPWTLPPAPVVWRTGDGGRSWTASQPLNVDGLNEAYAPTHFDFVDSIHGWLLVHVGAGMGHDYVALFRTTDGGANWTRVVDPTMDSELEGCAKTGMRFVDPLHGWVTGDCRGVAPGVDLFRSDDGGLTWQPVVLPAPAGKAVLFESSEVGCGSYSPDFVSPQLGRLVVTCVRLTATPPAQESFLYTTRDGGASWSSAAFPGGSLFFLDAQSGWALGRDVHRTRDGGSHWTLIKTLSWDGSFSFVDDLLGWAAARSGDEVALVQTTDGGKTWRDLKPQIAP